MAEQETNTGWRISMIGVDGIYRGLARGVSGFGLLVDGVNHSPRLLNLLPGVENFGPMSPRPFLGSAQIYDSLTGAHQGYKDLTGIVVPEPATTTERLAAGTGEALGLGAVALATGPVLGAANATLVGGGETALAVNAATRVSPVTQAFTTVAENPVMRTAGDMLQWVGSKALSLTGRFAISNPLLTTGIVAATDVAVNDGRLVTPVAKSAVNAVSERMGIGTIFGDSANPNGAQPGIANLYGLVDNPAKTAGMLAVIFGVNSILNNVFGNTLGLIASVAIALVFHQTIGNATSAVVDAGRDLVNGTTRQETPVPAPALTPR